jgi:putative ABC transport system permease protein
MIRHLFKLIWNRKRSNFLMIVEIFFSFIILFGVITLGLFFYQNYKKPLGFNYENVLALNVHTLDTPAAEKRERLEQIVKRLDAFEEVQHVAIGSENGPYSYNTWSTGLTRNNKEITSNMVVVQHDAFKDVMQLEMAEGRWFNESDAFSDAKPIIITREAKDQLFGDESAIGGTVSFAHTREKQNDVRTVIGVVEAYKPRGEMGEQAYSYFLRTSLADTSKQAHSTIYIRLKEGTPPVIEEKLLDAAEAIGRGWTFNLRQLADMRTTYLKQSLIPSGALFIVCIFLILNVALGLFGVLWQSINKRYSEIGLRRAIGASSGDIYRQFMGEIMVLATFGLILGFFFAIQFPILGLFGFTTATYLYSIAIAALLIYGLVLACALYPSRQAAAIHPAIALHEE